METIESLLQDIKGCGKFITFEYYDTIMMWSISIDNTLYACDEDFLLALKQTKDKLYGNINVGFK